MPLAIHTQRQQRHAHQSPREPLAPLGQTHTLGLSNVPYSAQVLQPHTAEQWNGFIPQRLKLLLGNWRLFNHSSCCIASSCCSRSSSAVSDRMRDAAVEPRLPRCDALADAERCPCGSGTASTASTPPPLGGFWPTPPSPPPLLPTPPVPPTAPLPVAAPLVVAVVVVVVVVPVPAVVVAPLVLGSGGGNPPLPLLASSDAIAVPRCCRR